MTYAFFFSSLNCCLSKALLFSETLLKAILYVHFPFHVTMSFLLFTMMSLVLFRGHCKPGSIWKRLEEKDWTWCFVIRLSLSKSTGFDLDCAYDNKRRRQKERLASTQYHGYCNPNIVNMAQFFELLENSDWLKSQLSFIWKQTMAVTNAQILD